MICPYQCNNKTEYGYCKTTGCINLQMMAMSYIPNQVVFTINGIDLTQYIGNYRMENNDSVVTEDGKYKRS